MLLSKILLKIVVAIALSTAAIFSYGHHGWSWYGDLPFILTAEVVDVAFGNPHDRLTLKDDSGQEWNVLLSPPVRSRRAGLSDEDVEVGNTVTAYGHRRREGDLFEIKTERLKVGERIFNLYPDRK